MPLIIITLIIAVVSGLFAPRRTALIITAVAAVLTLASFIWSLVDGQGNDPVWLLGVAVLGCGAAMAVAE
ncbi:MAG TPA: hypothetical protein VES03_00310, partial [Motilibacterales bacterium]|nr:hypothetical protein [Motilibacterales bacterium]